jgi:hypothetical protein
LFIQFLFQLFQFLIATDYNHILRDVYQLIPKSRLEDIPYRQNRTLFPTI